MIRWCVFLVVFGISIIIGFSVDEPITIDVFGFFIALAISWIDVLGLDVLGEILSNIDF